MTTEVAPPTIPPAQTGTPPKEWTSVLASKPTQDTPTWSSGILREGENPDISAERLRATSQVAQGVERSSRRSKKESRISLPSTELTGAQPSEWTGGIGALPGNLSESSVALLPDEREERAQERRSTSPRQRRDTLKPSAAGDGEELRKLEKEVAVSQDEPVTSELSVAPIQNTRGGETAESDVTARSDPEVESGRETGNAKNHQAPNEQQTASAIAMAGEVPGDNSIERSILVSEKPEHGKAPPQDVHQGDNGKALHSAKGSYGGDYHPALLHPPPPGASVAEYQSPVSTQRPEDASTMTGGTVGAAKKPGFMKMVKGEMKIFAGKISGDEHTVEEGKKLVHGSA